MKIGMKLPPWKWLIDLIERRNRETVSRAERFGKAKSHHEWLHGTFQLDVEVEKPKEPLT